MNSTTSRANRYRHVVFADPAGVELPRFQFSYKEAPRKASGGVAAAAAPWTQQERGFLRWLLAEAGLRWEDYRPQMLRRRLPACLRALRVESAIEARRLLRVRRELVPKALNCLLIGVTDFFRDKHVFDAISARVIPLLGQRLQRQESLRIWSHGCSNGAELYSVAMLLEREGLLPRCHLLGMDCRPDAVAEAAEGIYSRQDLATIPADFQQYFYPEPPGWRIDGRLRARTTWRQMSTPDGSIGEEWDLILCRNLVIYLQPAAAAQVWQQLAGALGAGGLGGAGGILVSGKAERPPADLGLVRLDNGIYRRSSQ